MQSYDSLSHRAFSGLAKFKVAMALLLFLPAGSLRYWQGWIFLGVFCGACVASTLYFLKHDPKLIERRMAVGAGAEQEPTQKIIMTITSVCFFLLILVPALSYRWYGSAVPDWLALASDAGVAASFWLVTLVLRLNSYAAATIRTEAGQPVISTGAYAWVRHPMYAAALPMFGFMPLALGSYWGLLVAVATLPALIWRLLDEERYLKIHLPGYADYCRKVRYRLIPYLW
jgi:protein-S-isoprenylcysteine O-methyltransferase Ste14